MAVDFNQAEWSQHGYLSMVTPFLAEIAARTPESKQEAFNELAGYLRSQGNMADGAVIAKLLNNNGLGAAIGQDTLQTIFNNTIGPSNISTVPGGSAGSNASLQFNVADAVGENENTFSGLNMLEEQQQLSELQQTLGDRGIDTSGLDFSSLEAARQGFASLGLDEGFDEFLAAGRQARAQETFQSAPVTEQAKAIASGFPEAQNIPQAVVQQVQQQGNFQVSSGQAFFNQPMSLFNIGNSPFAGAPTVNPITAPSFDPVSSAGKDLQRGIQRLRQPNLSFF